MFEVYEILRLNEHFKQLKKYVAEKTGKNGSHNQEAVSDIINNHCRTRESKALSA